MAAPSTEVLLWEGRPSLMTSAVTFFVCAALCWLIVPVIVGIYEYFHVRRTHYRVTSERILISHGILSVTTEELELYRVKDLVLDSPFLLGLAGRASIQIISTDKTTPATTLAGIPNAGKLKEAIRDAVEHLRGKKRRIA